MDFTANKLRKLHKIYDGNKGLMHDARSDSSHKMEFGTCRCENCIMVECMGYIESLISVGPDVKRYWATQRECSAHNIQQMCFGRSTRSVLIAPIYYAARQLHGFETTSYGQCGSEVRGNGAGVGNVYPRVRNKAFGGLFSASVGGRAVVVPFNSCHVLNALITSL